MSLKLNVMPYKPRSIVSFSIFLVVCLSITFAAEEVLTFESQVQTIGELIQQDNIIQAQSALDRFWAEHSADQGFMDAVRQIKDHYWANEHYAEHFDLCERIVTAFPDDPLAMNIWADDITGYVRVGNMAQAAEKFEEFWAKFHSTEGFIQHVQSVKDVCWLEEEYETHFDLCDRIAQTFPNDPLAVRIAADEVTGYIRLDEMDTAAAKIEQFWTRYKSNEEFVQNIQYIKDVCWTAGEYDTHFALCDRVAKAFPDNPLTAQIRTDEITGYIKRRNTIKAEEKLTDFLADYTSDEQVVEYLNTIASQYNLTGNYQKADNLYQYALSHSSPDDERLLVTRTGKLASRAGMDNDPNVVSPQVDLLLSEHIDNPHITESVHMLVEDFYAMAKNASREENALLAKRYYKGLVKTYERYMDQIPENDDIRQADMYYLSGLAYQSLGDRKRAVDSFNKIVQNHPSYERRWHALSMLAVLYEEMQQSNQISKAKANEKIHEVYSEIVKIYPASPPAQAAELWLQGNKSF